ncbi:MAG: nuclear transport factor 2 family protein [Candidatus Lokiarchaeia archaeon]
MITLERIEEEITEVIKKFAEAYEKKDLDTALSFFAPDPNVVVYGSGVDEKRIGLDEIRAQFERDFAQTEAASLEYDWKSISGSEPFAWLAADVTFKATTQGQEMTFKGRYTSLFEKREDKWLILQMHFSMPSSAQPEGESFPKP